MSMASAGICHTWSRPKKTESADTAIKSVVKPGGDGERTKLSKLVYTAQGTAHTLTVLSPLAETYVTTAAAGGATSLLIARDPGNYSANATLDGRPTPSVANNLIAANDFILVQQPDGNWLLTQPSAASTSGTTGVVTLTVPALPTGGIAANAKVYFFGATGDTNPQTGEAHPTFTLTASVTTTIGDGNGAVAETPNDRQPLLLYSNNATAAGILEYAYGYYGP